MRNEVSAVFNYFNYSNHKSGFKLFATSIFRLKAARRLIFFPQHVSRDRLVSLSSGALRSSNLCPEHLETMLEMMGQPGLTDAAPLPRRVNVLWRRTREEHDVFFYFWGCL